MNTVLFFAHELEPERELVVSGVRARHMFEQQGAANGDSFRVAQVGGMVGTAEVIEAGPSRIRLKIADLVAEPPPPALDVVVGISRPQTMKKILELAGSLGVRRLFLVRSGQTEKSYLSSRILLPENIFHHLRLGLEQVGSSYLPQVSVHPRFRPCLEDILAPLCSEFTQCFVADPRASKDFMQHVSSPQIAPAQAFMLAIGPEGGWRDFEVGLFESLNFLPITLGERVLRVEHALCYLLGHVAAARALSARLVSQPGTSGQPRPVDSVLDSV